MIGQMSTFDLETIVYGSFSAPHVQQAVATFEGCVSHANAPNFRSSIVLEKGDSVWRVAPYGYHQGIDASQCQLYELLNGREILVCRASEGHPDVSFESVYRWDFNAKETWRDLIRTINTWGACGKSALEESISSFGIQKFPARRMPGVSVKVSVVQALHSDKGGVCESPTQPPATNYQVDFVYWNSDFVVAPWSTSTKQHLDALFSSANK